MKKTLVAFGHKPSCGNCCHSVGARGANCAMALPIELVCCLVSVISWKILKFTSFSFCFNDTVGYLNFRLCLGCVLLAAILLLLNADPEIPVFGTSPLGEPSVPTRFCQWQVLTWCIVLSDWLPLETDTRKSADFEVVCEGLQVEACMPAVQLFSSWSEIWFLAACVDFTRYPSCDAMLVCDWIFVHCSKSS